MFPCASELRSVTAICVVEDVTKCPLGYTPIMRTHDLEADADLWKDGLFSRRVTRYVCLSKTQGRPEHVLESILILQDKEYPPEGYSIIANTSDTNSKAFKKKQLCYRLTPFKGQADSIVDVIILSKLKNPPEGYEPAGDVNGMHFCVRKISALTRLSTPGLSYGILPGGVLYPKLNDSLGNLQLSGPSGPQDNGRRSSTSNGFASPPYPQQQNHSQSASCSPAHQPRNNGYPPQGQGSELDHGAQYKTVSSVGALTLTQLCGLDGVRFQLREDLRHARGLKEGIVVGGGRRASAVSVKSQYELDHKYAYDFRTEQEALFVDLQA